MGLFTFRRGSSRVAWLLAIALSPSPLAAQTGGSVLGTVADSATGTPLAFALVELTHSGGEGVRPARSGSTDSPLGRIGPAYLSQAGKRSRRLC
jgi:hypothetical protein